MSGHSKWATTKRHKAAVDAKRGKLFSLLSKELTIAAREGGGDPEFNPRLRSCMAKAKTANMPADNVTRAIRKGTGDIPGVVIEEMVFEGFGPGGIGVIVEVTTDNKNRAISEVRSVFSKHGGNLAAAGTLAFSFRRRGQFFIAKRAVAEARLLEVALENGAEDIGEEGDQFEVLCPFESFYALGQALEKAQIPCESAQIAHVPTGIVEIGDESTAAKALHLLEKLEELEDVTNVYGNV
ncbi:MAG: YebC/PmpR family DNA-binding transcriptional regulator [Puniceicoccales bacterium]|jgi:YebC/PmpR family DNA-binding regulatory protein|nr:YebC/PmpR family DNA-binding transcriptional regulator [Puniceicoccales bacterium]